MILVNYILSLVFTTSPPHAAAETSVYDFTEKLIADESVCSDYKSATLLMRWEYIYRRTEERAIEEEQHAMHAAGPAMEDTLTQL